MEKTILITAFFAMGGGIAAFLLYAVFRLATRTRMPALQKPAPAGGIEPQKPAQRPTAPQSPPATPGLKVLANAQADTLNRLGTIEARIANLGIVLDRTEARTTSLTNAQDEMLSRISDLRDAVAEMGASPPDLEAMLLPEVRRAVRASIEEAVGKLAPPPQNSAPSPKRTPAARDPQLSPSTDMSDLMDERAEQLLQRIQSQLVRKGTADVERPRKAQLSMLKTDDRSPLIVGRPRSGRA